MLLQARIISEKSLLRRCSGPGRAGPSRARPAALRSASVENGKLCVRLSRGNQNGFQIRPGNISHTRNRSFFNAVQLFYAFPLQNYNLNRGYHGFYVKKNNKKRKKRKTPTPPPPCLRAPCAAPTLACVCVSSQKLISAVQQCQRHLSLGSLIPWHYTDTHLNVCR